MKPIIRVLVLLPLLTFLRVSLASAAPDWSPVTDDEKAMKSNPLDPGSGAVVLFKRGEIDVTERSASFWTTRRQTYERIKILTDAGRENANIAVDAPKWVRFSKVEGRTILPSGQVIPLDSSQVFRGRAFQSGWFAMMKTTFTLPSVEAAAIIEFQTEENVDWFYPPPWVFATEGLGTISSTLRVVVSPSLLLAQFPIETTLTKIAAKQATTSQGEQLDYSVDNLRPVRPEPYGLPFRDQSAMVVFSPYQLVFSGQLIPIIMNWNDVGAIIARWFTDMSKKDSEIKNTTKELAGKQPDERQRAEAIYQYLQRNMTSSGLTGVSFGGRDADDLITSKHGDPDEINALFVLMLKEARSTPSRSCSLPRTGRRWQRHFRI